MSLAPDPSSPDTALVECFTRVVAQFHLSSPAAQAAAALDSLTVRRRTGERRVWVPRPAREMEQLTRFFLPSVGEYLAGGSPHCVARRWDPTAMDYRGLAVAGRHVEYGARLAGCELYLFGTGILVLVFDLELESVSTAERASRRPGVSDLVAFNVLLQIAHPRKAPRLRMKVPEGRPLAGSADPVLNGLREGGLALPRIASLVLRPLREQRLGGEPADERTYRVQTFARVPAGHALADLAEPFYRLRRVVPEAYVPAPDDVRLDAHPEVVRTWGNIAVGASLEGMAMLAVNTDHPFSAELCARARHSYFAHYLLALHQRAALLRLAVQAGRLPELRGDAVPPGVIRAVRALRADAANFNLHHHFQQVSSHTPYAALYEQIRGVMCVPGLLAEVRDEVAELDEVIRRETADREGARARLLNQLVAVLGVLAIMVPLMDSRLRESAAAPAWSDRGVLVLAGVTVAAAMLAFGIAHAGPFADALSRAARRGGEALARAVDRWRGQRPAASAAVAASVSERESGEVP